MSYTWEDGELITAEKLNKTGHNIAKVLLLGNVKGGGAPNQTGVHFYSGGGGGEDFTGCLANYVVLGWAYEFKNSLGEFVDGSGDLSVLFGYPTDSGARYEDIRGRHNIAKTGSFSWSLVTGVNIVDSSGQAEINIYAICIEK